MKFYMQNIINKILGRNQQPTMFAFARLFPSESNRKPRKTSVESIFIRFSDDLLMNRMNYQSNNPFLSYWPKYNQISFIHK